MNTESSTPRPPLAVIVASTIALIHALGYLVLTIIFTSDALRVAAYRLPAALMAGASALMAIFLAALGWWLYRGKAPARAPLLVLLICETMAYLVTIGSYPWYVSAVGMLALVGVFATLHKQTRNYLGVADRPALFDDED